MRTFIAIELPDPIREALGHLSRRMRNTGANASWVRPENIHLTLRFLGEISEHDVNRIGERLALDYQAIDPFTLTISGTGVFPNPRKPSVIWVGAEPLEGPLATTQAIAESAAQAIGLPPETKPFRPHLTLARLRDPRQAGTLPQTLEQEAGFNAGAFQVHSVALFSSQLTPKGPIYRRLREFAL